MNAAGAAEMRSYSAWTLHPKTCPARSRADRCNAALLLWYCSMLLLPPSCHASCLRHPTT